MNKCPDDEKMHQYMGIEMNIQTWGLLAKKKRSEQENLRMIMFAKSSLYHWKKSTNFKPANEQRGEWMISRVFSVLEKGEIALSHAKNTIALTEKHELKDFDLAYAYESLARSYAALKNKGESKIWYKKAKQAGKLISDNKDKEIFNGDLKAGPWFNCLG